MTLNRAAYDVDPAQKAFATWCVMTHARPVLIAALRAWRLHDVAAAIERAASLTALRMAVRDADFAVRQRIFLGPPRRDLFSATSTLLAAITFARRGDAENTAAVVVGVFTNAASAHTWQRPWQRFGWRQTRAELIARVREEQRQYREARG